MISAENTSPAFAAHIVSMIESGGPFLVLKTLMGNNPDQNRRTIQNILTEDRPETFNAEMHEWTPDMEAACKRRCATLNSDWKAAADAFRKLNDAANHFSLMQIQSMGIIDAKPVSVGGGFCTIGDVTVTGDEIRVLESLRDAAAKCTPHGPLIASVASIKPDGAPYEGR